MTVLRAALYPRVSTEEQKIKGFSIEAQIDNLKEHCEKNKMKIVDIYVDEGVSGGKAAFRRPAMARLLEDVKAGKIDIILFTKLDRWFRNVKEYFKVQEILDEYGVEWRAIHEDYDTTTANGRMAITIFLAIAQNEREKTAERIKVVLEHKRKNKEACFGGPNIPLGYKKEVDENGVAHLVKDPETEQAVQEFWDILVKTNNLNQAIRHMGNAYGIKKNWKTWSRLTQREFYCGMYKGVVDYCPAYVTPEQFLKFQESKPIKATPTGRVYIFKGLLRCPVCGHKLCGDADVRPSGTYKLYRCTSRYRGCSNGSSISEKKIEKQLLEKLDTFLKDEIALAEIEASKPRPKPKVNTTALKEQIRRLTVVYMAGEKTDEQYRTELNELKALLAKAEATAPPEPRDLTPMKEMLNTDFRTMYLTFTDEEKQTFWLRLIKEIQMDGKTIKRVIFF